MCLILSFILELHETSFTVTTRKKVLFLVKKKIQVIITIIRPTRSSERIFNPMRCTGYRNLKHFVCHFETKEDFSLQKIPSAVRETGVSRHDCKSPLYDSAPMDRGVSGGTLNWAQMVAERGSIPSGSCTSDRCCISSPGKTEPRPLM